ncbi:M48 family metalloprotease [Desulfovibrio litoralis]|uniref:Putative metalloprotease n=1 Tax=Desulfovibrio litoralis DSM 11393 TaxID=1121455 RepID=A0A1M7SFP9_9BACT|nr:M48 family metalloprotease [Desulfovibrio litoralis]SHN57289.1 putative metalloprotease [Desulfovibrio litoralis DSM 11393]
MKKLLLLCLSFSLFAFGGCVVNTNTALDAAADGYKAATLSEADVISMSKQMREAGDKENKVASKNSKYTKRLNKVAANLKNVEGLQMNYKVYLTDEVNANVTPDGSVRVYSGLMDKLNDDELFFVLGHEIGHVKGGDTMDKMRLAYAASAARKGVAASNSTAGALAASELGAVAEAFLKAQFSQDQEYKADAYGLELMKKYKKNTKGAETALRKFADMESSSSGVDAWFSTHPGSAKRADKMAEMRAGK